MKKFFALALIMTAAFSVNAQLNPVSWVFSAKKIGDKTYEIHMTATIQDDWHLYSQNQPDDAIAMPTTFTINPNPLFTLDGKIKEVGKMEKFRDEKLDLSANQYSSTVSFVQVVKLKANVKTNFVGNVEFQTCDDKKCLPPRTVNFNIAIR
ncbi:MAG TPA: protein-disulfide reductase DsbD domain-containing protein [Chitinophagaceae bacterium]